MDTIPNLDSSQENENIITSLYWRLYPFLQEIWVRLVFMAGQR
jgi:hypothetical protein